MCARHDIQIGRYLLELEPVNIDSPGSLLMYLSFTDTADGDICWQGTVRMQTGAFWEADIYGGRPYGVDSHSDEVLFP